MKIARINYKNEPNWARLDEGKAVILSQPPYNGIRPSSEEVSLEGLKLLAPAEPSKIILVGLNYRDHARELDMSMPDEPVIFMKPPTALIGPGDDIVYPDMAGQVDYEAELALVIGRQARNIREKEAPDYILGYTCLNDVTARDLQKKDGQWIRAKGFDTFCPLGPCLETELDTRGVRVKAYLNGELKQDSSTADFIFDVNYLVSFISSIMTLLPGDVISTGTPKGVGSMHRGDKVEIEIEHIGRLTNKVI